MNGTSELCCSESVSFLPPSASEEEEHMIASVAEGGQELLSMDDPKSTQQEPSIEHGSGRTPDTGERRGASERRVKDYDEALVDRSLRGDKEAYRELVERYQGRLFSCAFDILKNREDAEDVVQEALVKAYLSLPEFQRRSSLYTWLYRIVYNMSIDFRRKIVRQGGAPVELDEAVSLGTEERHYSDPAGVVLRKQQSRKIQHALSEISEDHRRVIVLRELEGMSYEEIASVVGISRGTVMSRLHYARKKLQQALSEFAPFGRRKDSEVVSDGDDVREEGKV
jgi:RNA polymerase sigma-70 factor, ECF subfamily